MAEVRIAGEVFAFDEHALVAAGMEVVVIAHEDAALGVEFGPALLAVQRVYFFLVRAAVVVDNHVGVEADAVLVRLGDEGLQLSAAAVEGFGTALLVEFTKVEVVVGVVAHGGVACRLADGREP